MSDDSAQALRAILLAILAFGVVGTATELLLLEHTEGFWQLSPIVLLGVGLLALGWQLVAPRAASTRTLQAVMLLFVLSGGLGLGLHYEGNKEFELEMRPALEGRELFRRAMMGATPALAPGTMSLLGFIGLASTYRHPTLEAHADVFQ